MIAAVSRRQLRAFCLIAGSTALVLIAAASLPPFRLRLHVGVTGDIELGIAFVMLGLTFALAHPRWPLIVGVLLVGFAGALEFLQYTVGDIHEHSQDMIVKSLGVVGGVAIGTAINDEMNAMDTPKSRARE